MESVSYYKSSAGTAGIYLFTDPYSERIRMDDYHGSLHEVLMLINQHFYEWVGKVILKVRPEHKDFFIRAGYMEEAMVRGYFSGTDMYFLSQFLKPERQVGQKISQLNEPKKPHKQDQFLSAAIRVLKAKIEDAEALALFYQRIFKVYPSPVWDPTYIAKALRGNSIYLIIKEHDQILSAACAEIKPDYQHAEFSDCATLPEFNGRGFMKLILTELLTEMNVRGIRSIYSIARAASPSMNKAFQDLGFDFTGTLIKNVKIGTGLEDMNVWSVYR